MTLNPQIAPALAQSLEKKGFSSLTEVQEAMLVPEADGADLLVSAQTGSGKTVAFGMAIAPTIMGEDAVLGRAGLPLALIVAPTRELALQVQRELTWLYAEAGGHVGSCVGGMDPRAERRALDRGCHIVVGTPGRLRDHIERGALDMSELRAVVLDEADEMLDFGFREDLEFILDAAPAARRTLMFSATVPRAIARLAQRYQRDGLRISTVGERQQHGDIAYRALSVAPSDRENAIINTLRYYDAESALVFCATREAVNRMSSRFGNRGFAVVALSGELSQTERTHALQAMRDGRAQVCVATDVAARGIDLPGLELVIHADLPTNSDVLLHRSGRTGRAGRKGVCVLIVPHTRRARATRQLRDAKIQAEWGTAPSPEEIKAKDTQRLLADPALTEEYDEDALNLARELLQRHTPEQIAAAFLNRRQTELPAAEELLDAPGAPGPDEGPKKRRAPFRDGVWFRLTAGRDQRAEPRWLLPLICRLGHVTKHEVGAIKIGEKESRFEIAAAAADRFMEAVTASGGGEKSIRVTREGTAGSPPSGKSAQPREQSKPREKTKPSTAKPAAAKPPTAKPPAAKPPAAKTKPRKAKKKHTPKGRTGRARLTMPGRAKTTKITKTAASTDGSGPLMRIKKKKNKKNKAPKTG